MNLDVVLCGFEKWRCEYCLVSLKKIYAESGECRLTATAVPGRKSRVRMEIVVTESLLR